MDFHSRGFPVVAISVAALAAFALPSVRSARAAPANLVAMKNFDFAPMTLTVKAGTAVTWKNLDGEPHTVTSLTGLFRSGGLDENDSFTFRFVKPGVYRYVCSIHPRMMAAIIVK